MESDRNSLKIHVYKKVSLKNLKTLGMWQENLQSKMPELEFFKKLFFPRLFKKLQNWVNLTFFLIYNSFLSPLFMVVSSTDMLSTYMLENDVYF